MEKVHIPKDKDGRQRTFGFITYAHHASVAYALSIFSGTRLFNREISLKESTPNKTNTPTQNSNQNLKRSQSDSSVNQQPNKIACNDYSDNNSAYNRTVNYPFDKQSNANSHNPFDKPLNTNLHNPFDKPSVHNTGNPLADSPANFKRPGKHAPKDMSALRNGQTSRGGQGKASGNNMQPTFTIARKKPGSCLEFDVNALMRLSGNMLQLKNKNSDFVGSKISEVADNPFRRNQDRPQQQHQHPSQSHHNNNRSHKSNSDFKERNYNHKRKR